MLNESDLARFVAAVQQATSLSSAMPAVTEVVREAIDRNFREGGRFGAGKYGGGSQKWKPSRRVILHGGQTLIDRGALVSSIQVRAVGTTLIVGTNREYGLFLHRGTDDMDARPWITLTDDDVAEILATVADQLAVSLAALR